MSEETNRQDPTQNHTEGTESPLSAAPADRAGAPVAAPKSKERAAMGAGLLANTIFGFSFLFTTLALQVTSAPIMLSVRFFLAFLILNLLLLFRVSKLNLKGKPLGLLCLLGIVQPVIYFICESLGIQRTTSSFSGVMIALVPIAAMAFGALFLKEIPTVKQVISMVLSVAGVVVISIIGGADGTVTLSGVLFLVIAVLSGAAFNLIGRKISTQFSPFERTYVMFAFGFVCFTAIALIANGSAFFLEVTAALKNRNFIVAMLYLAGLSSVGAFLLQNYAVTHISATRAASFANMITVVSVLAGVFILHESFTLVQFICAAVIVFGIYGVNKFVAKDTSANERP